MVSVKQADLLLEYARLITTATVSDRASLEAIAIADKIDRQQYQYLEKQTGIPWWFIAGLHYMECDLSFAQHLANGDSIHYPTVNEPTGIPAGSWQECAIAALKLKDWVNNKDLDWTDPLKCLWRAEMWNGWGYRMYHPECLSPYLWSGTNHYKSGKYVADGTWDESAVSEQIGIIPIWLALGIDLKPKTQSLKPHISDVSNLKPMTIRPTYLVDVAKNFKDEPHQIEALKWLQSNIPEAILEKFTEEFSPPKPAIPKESKYQLRFRLAPANSDELILGTLDFMKDGKVYNTVTATSSLPGRQYSGSWNRTGGLLPPTSMVKAKTGQGLSVKTTPIYMPDTTGVSGNFYQISPFEMETDDATRGDWGIHMDANVPGSMGCVVATTDKGWAAVQREFKQLAGIGIRSVELICEYE